MNGKFNAYLLWPMGKSVKISKRRPYVYLEHKSNLIQTAYKLFQVILFWKLQLDPLFVRYSLDRESEACDQKDNLIKCTFNCSAHCESPFVQYSYDRSEAGDQ